MSIFSNLRSYNFLGPPAPMDNNERQRLLLEHYEQMNQQTQQDAHFARYLESGGDIASYSPPSSSSNTSNDSFGSSAPNIQTTPNLLQQSTDLWNNLTGKIGTLFNNFRKRTLPPKMQTALDNGKIIKSMQARIEDINQILNDSKAKLEFVSTQKSSSDSKFGSTIDVFFQFDDSDKFPGTLKDKYQDGVGDIQVSLPQTLVPKLETKEAVAEWFGPLPQETKFQVLNPR